MTRDHDNPPQKGTKKAHMSQREEKVTVYRTREAEGLEVGREVHIGHEAVLITGIFDAGAGKLGWVIRSV